MKREPVFTPPPPIKRIKLGYISPIDTLPISDEDFGPSPPEYYNRNPMPAKRKSTYRKRRTYKRRNYGTNTASLAKTLQRLTNDTEPYGPGTTRWTRYGPSTNQMMDNPGIPDYQTRTAKQNQNRAIDRYYGPGGYWQDLGRNLGHWGTRIAGAGLGAASGMEGGVAGVVGGALGGWEAGADISRAAGWGSYNVGRGSNDLIVGQGNGSAPVYHSAGAHDEMGDVIISNRELVQLVYSSSTSKGFKIEKFDLNPIDSTFHHLKQQAKQYEQFEFQGLMFQYVPMTGEGGSNALGVVGMAASYDPGSERTFSSMEDLMRFKGATTSKPSVGMLFGIECDPSKRPIKTMFTRDEVLRDKSFTDPATFYIATDGNTEADQVLGQLWVTYSCKLKNIKPFSEEAATDYLDGLHHPTNAKDSLDFSTSSGSMTSSKVIGSGEIIASATSISSTELHVNLTPTMKVGQVFTCMMFHTNSASASGASVFTPTLIGLEFVQIPGYATTNANDYLRATETNSDSSGIVYFKVRIIAHVGTRAIVVSRDDASNPQQLCGLTIEHADSEVHDPSKILLIR